VFARRFASYVVGEDASELMVLVRVGNARVRAEALLDRIRISERLGIERLYHVRIESRRRLGPLARRIVQVALFRHVDREYPATQIM
jgi:hypothetical protein